MSTTPYGLIATFSTPAEIMHAAERVRDAGYTCWDVITPFPIHGMDRAMGLKRSPVPRFSLTGGILGFITGMSMIAYMNWYDYPLVVGGKPYFSPLYAFPVSYELTILFTAFATIGGMFFLNRLPMHYHPVMKSPSFPRATDDRFLLVVETRDPKYSANGTRKLLQELGGGEIAELEA